jgi:hypothetical protein
LSNRILSLSCTRKIAEVDFYEKSRNKTKCLEVMYNLASVEFGSTVLTAIGKQILAHF